MIVFLMIMHLIPAPAWAWAMIIIPPVKCLETLVGIVPRNTFWFWGSIWSIKSYSTPSGGPATVDWVTVVTTTITTIIPPIIFTSLVVCTIMIIITSSTSWVPVLSGGSVITLIVPWPSTRWGYIKIEREPVNSSRLFEDPFTLHHRKNGMPLPELAVVLGWQ